jgi:hypothetical protein
VDKLKIVWLLWRLSQEKDMSKWIVILQQLLTLIGPDFKAMMISSLKQWQVKAKDTPTPIDDLVCNILLFLLGA